MKCPHCGTPVGNNLKAAKKGLTGSGLLSGVVVVVYCSNEACGAVLVLTSVNQRNGEQGQLDGPRLWSIRMAPGFHCGLR